MPRFPRSLFLVILRGEPRRMFLVVADDVPQPGMAVPDGTTRTRPIAGREAAALVARHIGRRPDVDQVDPHAMADRIGPTDAPEEVREVIGDRSPLMLAATQALALLWDGDAGADEANEAEGIIAECIARAMAPPPRVDLDPAAASAVRAAIARYGSACKAVGAIADPLASDYYARALEEYHLFDLLGLGDEEGAPMPQPAPARPRVDPARVDLVADLLEYVERFADANDEPPGGSCRTLIDRARLVAPGPLDSGWLLFLVGDCSQSRLMSAETASAGKGAELVTACALDEYGFDAATTRARYLGPSAAGDVDEEVTGRDPDDTRRAGRALDVPGCIPE